MPMDELCIAVYLKHNPRWHDHSNQCFWVLEKDARHDDMLHFLKLLSGCEDKSVKTYSIHSLVCEEFYAHFFTRIYYVVNSRLIFQ